MTDILCKWLNIELQLSQSIDQWSFAEAFASGYLIGEILQKYDLQDDFQFFSQSRTTDSKLNNFTRLEPTFRTLEILFNTNAAYDVMTEKPGVATQLLYQLYIALNNKAEANLTGVAMEAMRPRAPVKLEKMQRGPYNERLKILTPRQTDLNLDQLVDRFRDRKKKHQDLELKTRYEELESQRASQQHERMKELEKAAEARQRQTQLMVRIKAATVEMPRTPPNRTREAIIAKKELRKQKEAEETIKAISDFEGQLLLTMPAGLDSPHQKSVDEEVASYLQTRELSGKEQVDLVKPTSNDDYINKIRKKLHEDVGARKEREKRRRKVLVDQLKAHEEQEEWRREELLVNCLMRQSQQEKRIATQLLQLRHEKAVIRENRIFREKQYRERRQKDLQEAMDKESELARLAKIEYAEQIQRDRELHERMAKDRAAAKYQKHFGYCQEILMEVVDLTCKVGKYRELTNKSLPPKLMREWTLLFTAGNPVYEQEEEHVVCNESDPVAAQSEENMVQEEKRKVLDEGDFSEYKSMVGEWEPPDDCSITGPPRDNAVLGHVLANIFSIVAPPSPPSTPPDMPPFPVKACFLGKVFSGKTSAAQQMANDHGLAVLNVDELVKEAVDAYRAGESIDITVKPEVMVPLSLQSGGSATTGGGVNAGTDQQATGTPDAGTEAKEGNEEKAIEGKVGDTDAAGEERTQKQLELTPRAKLGQKAVRLMKKGLPIKDEFLIDVMVEAVKRVKEERGWIMDGFPSTINQAKLLEKALSGYDANSKPFKTKLKASRLAPDPKPRKDPPPPLSGIDMVILFDVPDDLALRRAAGRSYASISGVVYHEEFKPPPEGSTTGVGKQEKVLPVRDPAHDQEQIQHRLTGFQDSWKKLDKWFSSFGILLKVDAEPSKEELFQTVADLLENAKDQIIKAREDSLKKKEEEDERTKSTAPSTAEQLSTLATTGMDSAVPQATESMQQLSDSGQMATTSRGSRSGSVKRAGSGRKKCPKDKKRTPSAGSENGSTGSNKGKGSRKRSKSGSPKHSKARSKSPKKRTPTPEPEPETEPHPPPGPPLPQPGDEDWQWVQANIDPNLAHTLAPLWDNIEQTYISTSKHTFRDIRSERENIYHYLYYIRREFEAFLRRPDSKQEFASAFQKEYNDVAEDMREDEETKAELHQRVQDLKEQLWEISDNRKEEAENERQRVMDEGWLEDRLGLLTNNYLTLLQCEVDRYQDTLRLLKDYYQGVEGKIPEEYDPLYARIPLIDLSTSAKSGSEGDVSLGPSESHTRAITPTTPSAKSKKGKEGTEGDIVENDGQPRIPLIPRRPTSAEGFFPAQASAGDKGTGKGAKGRVPGKKDKPGVSASTEDVSDSPVPPVDQDEKLVTDAFQFGMMKVTEMTAAEMAAKEAEEAEREAARGAKGGKDLGKKRSKSKSPSAGKTPSGKKSPAGKKSPKKGKKAPTPTPPPTPPPEEPPMTPEEQVIHDRTKQEYFAALGHEELGLKSRMELIKSHAIKVLQALKAKAEGAYTDMDDWLGARFQAEMRSIDDICLIFGEAIEKQEEVQPEMVLIQDQFVINKEVKVYQTPSPPARPSPIERALSDIFTVEQLQSLLEQFRASAPSGFISTKVFMDTLSDLIALSHGTETLPDQWLYMAPQQLEQLVAVLSPDSEYVDWRAFLLQAGQSWPRPSQAELIQTLERFRAVNNELAGRVTRDQFERVSLWYDAGDRPPTPEDLLEPLPYDSITNHQKRFFDIFADSESDPPTLDYVQMLMYFSIDADPLNGFFRALSVASHTHMPRPGRMESNEAQIETLQAAKEVLEALTGQEDIMTPKIFINTLGPPDEGIPPSASNALVPLDALSRVFHHGQPLLGDSHRFSVTVDPEDTFSSERLAGVYRELGSEALQPVVFSTLMKHPIIQDCLTLTDTFRAPCLVDHDDRNMVTLITKWRGMGGHEVEVTGHPAEFKSLFTFHVTQVAENDGQSSAS